MTALPGDPFPPRFTLGRVLALTWRGYRQRIFAVTVICLAAGIAGTVVLVSAQSLVALPGGFWGVLIARLLQVGPAMLVVLPAVTLLLAAHTG